MIQKDAGKTNPASPGWPLGSLFEGKGRGRRRDKNGRRVPATPIPNFNFQSREKYESRVFVRIKTKKAGQGDGNQERLLDWGGRAMKPYFTFSRLEVPELSPRPGGPSRRRLQWWREDPWR